MLQFVGRTAAFEKKQEKNIIQFASGRNAAPPPTVPKRQNQILTSARLRVCAVRFVCVCNHNTVDSSLVVYSRQRQQQTQQVS